MAHMIENRNGKDSMAYVGEKPWHELGTKLPAGCTPKEMQIAAGLDWQVEKFPLTYRAKGEDNTTGHSALVRDIDGKMFDVVTDNWSPVQNDEAFDFFARFCDLGKMTMETAGALKDGQLVWALAKIKNGAFEAVKNDKIDSYVLFSNPHKYGASVEVRVTQIRVVCWNTLSWALSEKTNDKFRSTHAKKFDANMVTRALGLSTEQKELVKKQSEFLASKLYTPAQMTEYLQRVFPITGANEKEKELSQPAEKVKGLIDIQPGADFARGSFWNLFNAVTYAVDHKLGNGTDTRMQNAWFGTGQKTKIKALSTAVEMAMAS